MSDQAVAATLAIVALFVAGIVAVGAVLLIKVMRRRQAAQGLTDARLDTGVPAKPMSAVHAERLLRRYRTTALIAVALAVLVVLGVAIYR